MPTQKPSFEAMLGNRPKLVPVIHVENAEHAEPLLDALVDAGIAVVEVTLRSAAALKVIERMAKRKSPALIGAGTVTRPEQFAQVANAGATFAFGPAITQKLVDASRGVSIQFIPGIATPSEALFARENGFTELKFFPAELHGGMAWLKHIQPIYPDIRFCPTAGINHDNAKEFLALPNVMAVGGAFLAPRDRIEAGDWAEIRVRARKAVTLTQG
jgi:2-dehydro-3-deoxyphosphogluconate aldolase/(4S)-4-hydroxy-2-oxoglutarate aldolase